ncbi:MAG: hypothetical protein ACI8RZ_004228 [Myxococcota bacterium]|jgi:hypothetical protein
MVLEGLDYSPVQTCDDPSPLGWTAIGEAMPSHSDPDTDHNSGGGLIIEDLDGDGNLDLSVLFLNDEAILYFGDGAGGFPRSTMIRAPGGEPVLADFSQNGALDILLSTARILFGDGTGEFRQSKRRKINGVGITHLPDDFNNDGMLDIFFAHTDPGSDPEEMRDQVAWGKDGGGFTLDEEALALESAGRKAFDAVLLDWDSDGDRDIYVVNDMGYDFGGNVLWRNDGDTFTDVTDDCACGVVMSGMGVSAADYNRDGIIDLYITATAHNVLLAGGSDGLFTDVTAATAADPLFQAHEMSWGSAWVDHDNDGDLDIIVLQGDLWASDSDHGSGEYEAPIHLMSQEEGLFSDVAPDLGITQLGSFRAVIAAELNGDGVPDFVVTDVVEHPWVFLSEGCTENAWLEVIAPEHSKVVVESGGITQTAIVSRDTGFSAAGPERVWFGLGAAQTVDRLTITTPDGVMLTGENIAARRRVSVPL